MKLIEQLLGSMVRLAAMLTTAAFQILIFLITAILKGLVAFVSALWGARFSGKQVRKPHHRRHHHHGRTPWKHRRR